MSREDPLPFIRLILRRARALALPVNAIVAWRPSRRMGRPTDPGFNLPEIGIKCAQVG
jgi:hypothetical protein